MKQRQRSSAGEALRAPAPKKSLVSAEYPENPPTATSWRDSARTPWLNCPQIGLGGAVPLEFAQTTFGFREVEKLLTRIDHGVYA
jgi:Protein of unknown function (DUF2384)